MNKPWWLWEGAAVRWDGPADDGYGGGVWAVRDFEDEECIGDGPWVDIHQGHVRYTGILVCDFFELGMHPIENPAVMLAPDWATYVQIGVDGYIFWGQELEDGTRDTTTSGSFHWPQCPDHLKGTIWELPK